MIALFVLFACLQIILLVPNRYRTIISVGTEMRAVEANDKFYMIYNTNSEAKYTIFTDMTNFDKKNEGQLLSGINYATNARLEASRTQKHFLLVHSDKFISFNVDLDRFAKMNDHALDPSTSISTFWDIVPLNDGGVFVVSVTSEIAKLWRYQADYSVIIDSQLPLSLNLKGGKIACISFISLNHLLCAYQSKTQPNNEFYTLFDLATYNVLSSQNIEQSSEKVSYGEKIILLDNNRTLICTLKYETPSNNVNYLFCFVGDDILVGSQYEIVQISPKGGGGSKKVFVTLSPCDLDIKYVSIAKINNNTFVNTCLHQTNKNQIVFSYITYVDNQDFSFNNDYENKIYPYNIGFTVSFNSLIVFPSSKLIGLFYVQGSSPNEKIQFELLNGPNCQDFTVSTSSFINTNTTFTFASDTFINGIFLTNKTIQVAFELDNTQSLIIFKNDNKVSLTDLFTSNEEISYNTGSIAGTIAHKFIAKDSFGFGVNVCKIYFTVKACHLYCLKCTTVGTDINMECDECNKTAGYYPYSKKPKMCYTITSPPLGTAFDSETQEFIDCFKTCASCSAIGDINSMYCSTCATASNYYPLFNDSSKCYGPEAMISGIYLDTSGSPEYKFCSLGCAHCIFQSNAEVCQICDSAKFYYPLSDNTSDCRNNASKPLNYYFSVDKYYPCFSKCSTCAQSGTLTEHNCDTCGQENSKQLIKQPLKETNCVEECESNVYWYVDNALVYHCTTVQACPQTHPYLVEGTTQCTNSCVGNENCVACNTNSFFKYEEGKQCVKKCPPGTQADMVLNECILSDICKKTTSNRAETAEDFSKIKDQIAKDYSTLYSSTDKQVDEILNPNYKVVIYKNETCAYSLVPDLGKLDMQECITKLRKYHTIPITTPIITLTMSLYRVNQTNQVAYAFYNSIDGSILNMEICKDEKIIVTVPMGDTEGVDIDKAKEFEEIGVDVYNGSDPFFNDICFEYSTGDGKDVTLEDRKKSYYQNVSICEEGCTYKGVNLTEEEVSCECEVKTSFITELLDNPLTGEILSFLNQANFEIIKCYEDVFNLKKMIKNIGSWILIGLALIEVGLTIYYSQIGVYPVHAFLLQYIKVNPPKKSKLSEEKEKDKKSKVCEEKKISYHSSLPEIDENNPVKIDFDNNSPSILIQERTNSNHRLKLMNLNQNYLDVPESGTLSSGKIFINQNNNIKQPVEQITSPEEAEEQFEEFELNDLELEDAIKHDKRGFCKIYWQLLQENQTIINTFCTFSSLESFPIKAICFFFSLGLFFTVNALFYDESYISKQFNSKEPFNLLYLLKNEMNRCIYSTIVSFAVGIILSFLFSSKKKIRSLIRRHKDNQDKLRSDGLKIVKGMRIMNIAFIVINFILMFAFWYFISAFCAIFPNSQGSWLIGCGITYIFTFLLPFALSFLGTFFRFLGIKCNCDLFYRLSQFIT